MSFSPNRRPEGRAGSALAPALQNYIQSVGEDSNWRSGTIHSTCPECSHKRKKKKARCLSVTVHDDRAVFRCLHCEIRGVVFRDGEARLSHAEQAERRRIADADLLRDTERRIAYARQVWDAAIPATGTPVERYLHHRGFDLVEIPPTLRYARLKHYGTGETYDVMVAAVGYGPVPDAVHRTYLAPGGNGKARLPDDFDAKLSLGPVRGRPIRLDSGIDAEAAGGSLAIAEGIENALVAVQEFGVPAWSAISAGNLPLLRIPDIDLARHRHGRPRPGGIAEGARSRSRLAECWPDSAPVTASEPRRRL